MGKHNKQSGNRSKRGHRAVQNSLSAQANQEAIVNEKEVADVGEKNDSASISDLVVDSSITINEHHIVQQPTKRMGDVSTEEVPPASKLTMVLWNKDETVPSSFQAGHYPDLKAVSMSASSFNTNCLPVTTRQLIDNEENDASFIEHDLSDPIVRQTMVAKKVLYVCLLSITRAKAEGKADVVMYQKRGKRVKVQASYSRKLTFASLLEQQSTTVTILEKNNDEHNHLFHWNLSLTKVKPGTCFVIQNPRAIGQLASKSTIVETSLPLIQLQDPKLKVVHIVGDSTQHQMRYFLRKEVKIYCDQNHLPVPWKTSCNGDACDRLEFNDKCLLQCGCWNQNSKNDSTASNAVFKFDFWWKEPHLSTPAIRIKDFTSLRTSKLLFQNERIVSDYDTLAFDKNVECIQMKFLSLVSHTNNNGGWTIVGWYIRGEKENDDNRDENEARLLSEHIKYHVCYLYPTKLDPSKIDSSLLFGRQDITMPTAPSN